MLRQKALIEVLNQMNTSETYATYLFNKEGVLLAFSGRGQKKENPTVAAALIASVWDNFDKKSDLKEIMLNCEDGVMACTKVANMLIAVKATKNAPLGLLRTKLRALAKHLELPLSVVSKNV